MKETKDKDVLEVLVLASNIGSVEIIIPTVTDVEISRNKRGFSSL